jgi:murein DD-endopeptidase MepM/ murein hydrolase activator NlpD
MRLAVLAFLLLAVPAQAASWRAPVGGPVARGFDLGSNPFEGGRHRGADFAASPGAAVHAPCRGRVVVAGRVASSGGVVTLLCGRWRVSLLPLAAVSVRRRAVVRAGARVGTLAPSHVHAGVHLGVRRDGSRFGYVDPLRFLEASRPAAPPLAARRGPRGRPPRPVAPAPRPRPAAPSSAFRPAPALAPWPAWAGLALVLGGAGVRWRGVVVRRVLRRRRTSTAAG